MAKVSPEPNSGCWLWLGSIDRKGYGQIRAPGSKKLRVATHVAWELAGRTLPSGMHVLHRCDMPACVNPDHLFFGTPQDNTDDMIAKGRVRLNPVRGSRVGGAKLTETDIPIIRSRLLQGETLQMLSDDYGVNISSISQIRLRKTWRHVE